MNNHNYNLDEEITLFTFTQNDIKKLIKNTFHISENQNFTYYNEFETLKFDLGGLQLFENSEFFDYLAEKVKVYELQRLLTQLLVLHAYQNNECIKMNEHFVYYNEKQTWELNTFIDKSISKIDSKNASKGNESHIRNDDIKTYKKSYESKTDYLVGTANIEKISLFNYNYLTPFTIEQFIRLDETLLYWNQEGKPNIPEIYSLYHYLIYKSLNLHYKNNYFSWTNKILKNASNPSSSDTCKTYFSNIINEYNSAIKNINESLTIPLINKTIERKLLDETVKKQYIKAIYCNYIYLIDNVFANDFFSSVDTNFFIDSTSILPFSSLIDGSNFIVNKIKAIEELNLLELLATFNMDLHIIDKHIIEIQNGYHTNTNDLTSSQSNCESPYINELIEESFRNYTITNNIALFKFNLHSFLLKAIEFIMDFCQIWTNKIIEIQKENNKDVFLIFINLIGDILSEYIPEEPTYRTINMDTEALTAEERLYITYLFHYFSIHRDIKDRIQPECDMENFYQPLIEKNINKK